ncbi:MAG: pre-rRNA processing protein [Cirrosporium novae-zelandiae]|nr:MAG: pre-rRNA processing protein [Cirrosporium novae-zelandiae]
MLTYCNVSIGILNVWSGRSRFLKLRQSKTSNDGGNNTRELLIALTALHSTAAVAATKLSSESSGRRNYRNSDMPRFREIIFPHAPKTSTMSSFFTVPASQKKRKRAEDAAGPSRKKAPSANGFSRASKEDSKRDRDDSISGSDSDDDDANVPMKQGSEEEEESDSDDETETAGDRRLRLAERYLENIRQEVDEVGFDAEQIDKDLIAERLKEDVAEERGLIYRSIASDLDFSSASHTFFRLDTQTTTGVATCSPYAYTVSKDMTLIKWQLAPPPPPPTKTHGKKSPRRTRPKKLLSVHGNPHETSENYQNHTRAILCVAASSTNKYVATGGLDKRVIIWDAETLTPLKVFNGFKAQHRDAILSLTFRLNSNQLFSASRDRTLKVWSCDELAYTGETLFGHQDEVVQVKALHLNQCVSVGARDRSARLWKIVEESQLVFNGGSNTISSLASKHAYKEKDLPPPEQSLDVLALLTPTLFVTGSSAGTLSLWSTARKKPVSVLPYAHGLEPPPSASEMSAEKNAEEKDVYIPPPQARWITALAAIPGTDLVISGSWDGWLRAWKVIDAEIQGKKGVRKILEPLGAIGYVGSTSPHSDVQETVGHAEEKPHVRGIINDISIFERGERGKDGICIVAATGKEHRLGRWKTMKDGKNGAVVFEVPRIKR